MDLHSLPRRVSTRSLGDHRRASAASVRRLIVLAGMGLSVSLLGAAGTPAQPDPTATATSEPGAPSTAGTASSGRGESDHSAATGVSDGRPIIARSSAETYASVMPDPANPDVQSVLAGVGASQLEFFDDLERQSLVCHDDALHACLLLGAGINATTFEQRTQMAARMGWISPTFDRPAREAATLGEISRMLCRMMGKPESITQEESLRLISGLEHTGSASTTGAGSEGVSHAGGLPSQLKPYQGLTGSQLITILGTVHDAIAPRRTGSAAVSSNAVSSTALAPTKTEALSEPEVVVVQPEPALQPDVPAAAPASSAVDEVIAELTGEATPATPATPANATPAKPVVPPASAPAAAQAPASAASVVVSSRVEPAAEAAAPDAAVGASAAPAPAAQVTETPAPVPTAPVASEPPVNAATSTEPAAPITAEQKRSEAATDPARFSQFRPGKPVKRPAGR